MAYMRQFRPYSRRGFQVKVLQTVQDVESSLGSGRSPGSSDEEGRLGQGRSLALGGMRHMTVVGVPTFLLPPRTLGIGLRQGHAGHGCPNLPSCVSFLITLTPRVE